jgi:predicted metalloprotease with PDZ domain
MSIDIPMKQFLAVLLFSIFLTSADGQKLSYEVSFPNLSHHEGHFELTVAGAKQNSLVFRMSRSSPGRYATHEYGKNVYDVKAFDQKGKELAVLRVDGDIYEVVNNNGFTRLEYTLFANYPDGTYAGIDPGGMHFNIPASFMWVKELEKAPIEVKFTLPQGKNWTIATQLNPTRNPNVFTAPDLQYFMDSPIKIGALSIKEWTFNNGKQKPAHFRLALEVKANDSLTAGFASKVKRVTEETREVYGEYPPFENGQYTFLASINPYVKGDGMEHRNSTVIHLPTVFTGASNLLGVFSHEFFHAWNVERLRPKTLEPFNYEKSNMSFELWFAEGFTQYYGELILKRAGFVNAEDYTKTIASLVNTKENTAGAKRISPAEASCMAVFVDAGVAVDKTNYQNVYTSYYPYGASIALALDLELRSRNLSLDQYMQAVWKEFGKTEVPYIIADLESVLAKVTKNPSFASSFFRKYVYGHDSFDYTLVLLKAGMTLKKQFPGEAWLGDVRWKEGAGLTILSNTIIGTPLYTAGLDLDDQLLKLDGKTIGSASSVQDILKSHKPGDQISVEFQHREEVKMTTMTLIENPRYTVELNEKLNLPVTEDMIKFRKDWLESKLTE